MGLSLPGDYKDSEDSSSVSKELKSNVKIFLQLHWFAALKEDGSVVTWEANWGGPTGADSSEVQDLLKDIEISDPFGTGGIQNKYQYQNTTYNKSYK